MSKNNLPHSVVVLGSTGSIGTQTLDVAQHLQIPVEAICAGRDVETVEAQARKFGVKMCAMGDVSAANDLRTRLADTDILVFAGERGIGEMIACASSDLVLNSIIGEAGLAQTLATIRAGKQLALANKESLVVAGEIVMREAAAAGISIRPVDSEHCAIAQCLEGHPDKEVKNLILTASGGPFFGRTKQEVHQMRAADALAHPTWSMGAKITVDSATMMNKGFEVIEACHLFAMPEERVQVVVHRESIIHSMVEYIDNSVLAQLAVPDMRLCIQHALTYPDRAPSQLAPLNLAKIGKLTFYEPDEDTFELLHLARTAIRAGGAHPAVLNAANEVAVAAFLSDRICFGDIAEIVLDTIGRLDSARDATTIEEILDYDARARRMAAQYLQRRVI
ncbi:MAG: 1-deoxy-D-xylulose-5-phosphate reductoisomerase [Clostridia bacterium]|nr:1-deoxy-D-xylulose-5-phosphate reductoisomerase [Clostridia bacterium]